MADITLRHGGATENNVKLTDDGVTYVYRPRFLSRTALRGHEAAVAARREHLEKLAARDKPSDREHEKLMRLTCDVIRSLLAATSESTPDAGDLLYDGWASKDTVAEDQIVDLFLRLMGVDLDALAQGAEGGSPS